MLCFLRGAVCAAVLAAFSAWADGSALATARSGIEQWVQIRQILSRTQADWAAEKEMLLQSRVLFERELTGIDEKMHGVSTNSTEVERERRAAEEELNQSKAVLERARHVADDMEGQIRALVPRLPAPLVEILQPHLNRLPMDAAATRATAVERMQTVVSLLNEIDKFNNAVSVFAEKRPNGAGTEVAVETVYLGLGVAYFVNEAGDFAGTGKAGDTGWDWSIDSALGPSVREVVRIYRNQKPARFLPLPVTIR